jgi:hypothetical protein
MLAMNKKIYIRTFGWPMVTVARDGAGGVKEGKCFGMKGLRKLN